MRKLKATSQGTVTVFQGISKAFKDANKGALVAKGAFAALGVGLAIYLQYRQKVKQAEAEARTAQLEAAEAAVQEVDSINELYDAYSKAKIAYANNTGSKEALDAATGDLLEALGMESDAVEALQGSYETLDEAIQNMTRDKLKDYLFDMESGLNAAKGEVIALADEMDGTLGGAYQRVKVESKEAEQVFADRLQSIGYDFYDAGTDKGLMGPSYMVSGITSSIIKDGKVVKASFEDIQEQYNELIAARDSLSAGVDEGLYSLDELTNSALYTYINSQINQAKSAFAQVQDYVDNINETQARVQIEDWLGENELPRTKEEFIAFRDEMTATAIASGLFAGTQEDIATAIDSVASSMTGFDTVADTYRQELSDIYGSAFSEFSEGMTDKEIKILYGIYQADTSLSFDELQELYEEAVANIRENPVTINIETEKDGMAKVNTALSESLSLTGLQSESITNLTDRYKDLKGFNPSQLFEKTAAGVKVNTQAMRELESAYRNQKKAMAYEELQRLIEQYQELDSQIKDFNNTADKTSLINQRTGLQEQIEQTTTLIAQYDGLTSAFQRWQDAQSGPKNRDTYEGVIQGFEDVDDLISRGWVDDEVRAFVDAMSFKDLSTAGYDEIMSEWDALNANIDGTTYKVRDFFTKNDDGQSTTTGLYNFFDALVQKGQEVGETFAYIDEQGGYHLNFGMDDSHVAELMNMDVESVQHLLEAMRDAGWDIDLTSPLDAVDNLGSAFENMGRRANTALQEVGATDITFNFDETNLDELDKQIEQAKSMIDNMKDDDGELKVGFDESDLENANTVLETLEARKLALSDAAVMHIDVTNADTDIATVIQKLQNFKQAITVSANTDEVTNALAEIQNSDADILAQLDIDPTSAETCLESINALDLSTLLTLVPDATQVSEYMVEVQQGQGIVTWTNDTSIVDAYAGKVKSSSGVVTWSYNDSRVRSYRAPTKYGEVVYTVRTVGTPDTGSSSSSKKGGTSSSSKSGNGYVPARPTVVAQGTAYAKGSGNWGLPNSGVGFGGEVGPEIRVRDGKWELIGAESAEFFNYERGDIIFNAEQTRQILANGKIKNGKKRGVVYAQGSAFSRGSGPGPSTVPSHSTLGDKTGSSSSSKSYTGNGADDTEDTIEKIDWIEIAIDRLERAISQLDITAKSTFKNLSNRTTAAYDEMLAISQEIELQNEAVQRYYAEAQSIGLSEDIAKLVRDGTIDINQYDEDTRDLIEQYQEW